LWNTLVTGLWGASEQKTVLRVTLALFALGRLKLISFKTLYDIDRSLWTKIVSFCNLEINILNPVFCSITPQRPSSSIFIAASKVSSFSISSGGIVAVVFSRNPQTAELIKRIRSQEPEWVFALAMRKWNANYTRYHPAERIALENWIGKLRSNEVMVEQQRLRTNGATNSLKLLDVLRAKTEKKS
jgi:hypothetical protein